MVGLRLEVLGIGCLVHQEIHVGGVADLDLKRSRGKPSVSSGATVHKPETLNPEVPQSILDGLAEIRKEATTNVFVAMRSKWSVLELAKCPNFGV